MARRGYGEDAIYFDHSGECRDERHHRACPGRWRGEVSLGFAADGKRLRRKVSGHTKQDVKDKLKALHDELEFGVQPTARYTVRQAVEDWLSEGLDGRSASTVTLNRHLLRPVVEGIGRVQLRLLTSRDVRRVLMRVAETRSSRTMVLTHNALERAIRHAEANDLVRRNVASVVRPPAGQEGRPSKSLTAAQASALLGAAAADSRIGAYVVLCLLSGVRTEEARALTWEHVDLDGDPTADPPVPPHVEVWRSVREHGDTKTEKSRRTLQLPSRAVEALRQHRLEQAKRRLRAGELWQELGLVFCTSTGTMLDAGNVRKMFRRITLAAGIGEDWTPRELRTSFVSLMSGSGVPVEEIAHLAGHCSSRTTEVGLSCPAGGAAWLNGAEERSR